MSEDPPHDPTGGPAALRARVRETCLRQPTATTDRPFGPDTEVVRVGGKIFALLGSGPGDGVNLKAEPPRVDALVEAYAGITRGYHMNKRHWVTVALDGSVPDDLIVELVEDSFDLVVDSLPRSRRPVRDDAGG